MKPCRVARPGIPYSSPIGEALIGKESGEIVEVQNRGQTTFLSEAVATATGFQVIFFGTHLRMTR